jgi:hypothetical protein
MTSRVSRARRGQSGRGPRADGQPRRGASQSGAAVSLFRTARSGPWCLQTPAVACPSSAAPDNGSGGLSTWPAAIGPAAPIAALRCACCVPSTTLRAARAPRASGRAGCSAPAARAVCRRARRGRGGRGRVRLPVWLSRAHASAGSGQERGSGAGRGTAVAGQG